MASKRYQVLQAIRDRLEEKLDPKPAFVRIGYLNYQGSHNYPAVFVLVGPGSSTRRMSHQSWEHDFVVRIEWLSKGSDAEPLEHRGLMIHDQLLTMFDEDRRLGGLVLDIAMVNEFGSDEGQLALAGSPIGPFWQDFLCRMVETAV